MQAIAIAKKRTAALYRGMFLLFWGKALLLLL